MGSINNSSYLLSVGAILQGGGVSNPSISNNPTAQQLSASSLSALAASDQGQISPFAQILSSLQQLQQTNPAEYQQVTQQISTNLASAAQTAQASGNTAAAGQLNQLSTDFSNASKSGQLPNIQDLAQAVSGHHHHHGGHGHAAPPADSDSSTLNGTSSSSGSSGSGSSTSGGSTSNSSQTASQLFASFLANGGQTNTFDPSSIILNTLTGAGLTGISGA